jgi:hypothetical protein
MANLKKIPKFNKADIETAHLCAKALWYGIDYSTGNPHRSDADLLNIFFGNFNEHAINKNIISPRVFRGDVKELIIAAKVYILFRGINGMNFTKGIATMYSDIFPRMHDATKNPQIANRLQTGQTCLWKLSKGIVVKKHHNRIALSSRILFYLTPNLMIFNYCRPISKYLGLSAIPQNNYISYYKTLEAGLKINQSQLGALRMPPTRDGLTQKDWDIINKSDWWQRRVLDLAILIQTGKFKTHPNLRQLILELEQAEKAALPNDKDL